MRRQKGVEMKRRLRIGVAADDVTGANDIGIMFRKGGYRAAVFPLALADRCSLKEEAEGLDVIILDTDSRFDTPERAQEKVRQAAERLMELPCDRYFNKTCSVFRGNIGAEFDAMQDVLQENCSMVILGFPQNGRTTVDGIHYVYGKKLEDSQFRNDPIHPMTTSSLEELIHRQSDRKTAHITWRDLDQGLAHVLRRKEELKKQCSYLIFDIRDQEDLKLAAKAVADERNLCGSSAIGEELPAAYAQLADLADRTEHNCKAETQVFSIAGSLTVQSIAQVNYMKKKGYPVLEFPTESIYDPAELEMQIGALSRQAVRSLKVNGSCLVHTANDPERIRKTKERGEQRGMTDEAVGKAVSHAMCAVVRRVLTESGCRKLAVAGGDTSAAVTEELEIYRMDIGEEIEPGVPVMTGKTIFGPMDLVLKSGSFGSEAFLEKAAERLRRE